MDLTFPRRWQPLILGSLLVGAIILFFGWTGGDDDGSVIGWAVVVLLAIGTAYGLWRFFGARTGEGAARESAAVPALVLGVLALLTAFVYWTGFVYAIAPAAIALGIAAGPDTRGRIGLALGAAGLAVAVVGGFVDGVL